jgi:cytochrome c biogenesis protein CcmG/thiol:disulfide interchange protein DsbE
MKFALDLLRDWGIAFAAVLVAFAAFNFFAAPRPKSEGPAPAFASADLTGAPVSLASLDATGDVVVLNFWFTTCPPCRHEIPELARFHEERPDVPLVGISVDRNLPTDRLAATSKRLGINYPVVHDADMAISSAYGVGVFPTTVLVRDGQIVATRVGEVNGATLTRMLDEL